MEPPTPPLPAQLFPGGPTCWSSLLGHERGLAGSASFLHTSHTSQSLARAESQVKCLVSTYFVPAAGDGVSAPNEWQTHALDTSLYGASTSVEWTSKRSIRGTK